MSDASAVSEQRYRITYSLKSHPKGIDKKDIPKGHGACDALLIASLIYPQDGSLSLLFVGKDGRTDGELDDREWFKVWVFLASRLSKSKTLDRGRCELAGMTFEVFRAAMLGDEKSA